MMNYIIMIVFFLFSRFVRIFETQGGNLYAAYVILRYEMEGGHKNAARCGHDGAYK
jgi:hypothetical protein